MAFTEVITDDRERASKLLLEQLDQKWVSINLVRNGNSYVIQISTDREEDFTS